MQNHYSSRPSAVLFDFDGTLSTLREGWEEIMRPLMLEMIAPPGSTAPQGLAEKVDIYIAQSTGIQTIYQMQWLQEQISAHGLNPEVHDVWWYKDEYNRRLMERVDERTGQLAQGKLAPDEYLVPGSRALLEALRAHGIAMYVASGTDDLDVKREARLLGIDGFFAHIQGAPHRQMGCSKETVLKSIMEDRGLRGPEVLIIGDGKVEIGLGYQAGTRTLGIAFDKKTRERLKMAGADHIIRDYLPLEDVLAWMGLRD